MLEDKIKEFTNAKSQYDTLVKSLAQLKKELVFLDGEIKKYDEKNASEEEKQKYENMRKIFSQKYNLAKQQIQNRDLLKTRISQMTEEIKQENEKKQEEEKTEEEQTQIEEKKTENRDNEFMEVVSSNAYTFKSTSDPTKQIFIEKEETQDFSKLTKYSLRVYDTQTQEYTVETMAYLNDELDFENITEDSIYKDGVQHMLDVDRIERRKQEAQEYGSNYLYIGTIRKNDKDQWQMMAWKEDSQLKPLYEELFELEQDDIYFKEHPDELDRIEERTRIDEIKEDKFITQKIEEKRKEISDLREQIYSTHYQDSQDAQTADAICGLMQADLVTKYRNTGVRWIDTGGWENYVKKYPKLALQDWCNFGTYNITGQGLNFAITREDGSEIIIREAESNIPGIKTYILSYDLENKFTKENTRIVYSEGLNFAEMYNNPKYAIHVREMLDEKNLNQMEEIARENGCDYGYIGSIVKSQNKGFEYERYEAEEEEKETIYKKIKGRTAKFTENEIGETISEVSLSDKDKAKQQYERLLRQRSMDKGIEDSVHIE